MQASNSVLLGVEEMARADGATIEGGTPGIELMEAAGGHVARVAADLMAATGTGIAKAPVGVLCGPGNNGGDGYVAARLLREAGHEVRLGALGDRAKLAGDAAEAARRWGDSVFDLADIAAWARDSGALVIDAIFGAGLSRPIEGALADLLDGLQDLRLLAVDMPSGVHGDSGEIWGTAPRAQTTVTFFRAKPGHWLYPGRDRCGHLHIVDIGIAEQTLDDIGPQCWVNDPALWADKLPWPRWSDHKYRRGHALFVAGHTTGAARLAAQAARRAGAGLMTIAGPAALYTAFAADAPGIIVTDIDKVGDELDDKRRNAVALGPGLGVGTAARDMVLAVLAKGRATVLDADALTSFAGDPEVLFDALGPNCVLTPHDGEYARLFTHQGDRLTRARKAAAQCAAVVVLKGPDTVIAAPDGRAAINNKAPPSLATGGTGDVLTGLVLGLLAQHMPAFEAAAAAVWMHGAAAEAFGPGLLAEDVIDGLPGVWRRLGGRAGRKAG